MDDTKMQLSGEDATFENDDLISRRAAIRLASGGCHPANVAKELAKLPPAQTDLSGYSDRLWKNAYERGKAEAENNEEFKKNLSRTINAGIVVTNAKDVYSCGMRNGMRWCRSLLEDEPPKFEKAQQWIPCSERLPTEEKDYIVSIDYGDEQHIGSDMFIIPEKGDPFWLVSDHVVAWMEGPEPYRKEGKHD